MGGVNRQRESSPNTAIFLLCHEIMFFQRNRPQVLQRHCNHCNKHLTFKININDCGFEVLKLFGEPQSSIQRHFVSQRTLALQNNSQQRVMFMAQKDCPAVTKIPRRGLQLCQVQLLGGALKMMAAPLQLDGIQEKKHLFTSSLSISP